MEQQLTNHRYQVLYDVRRLHEYAQTTKQHQKNIAELIHDIYANGSASESDLIEYLQEEFLTHTAPDIKPKLKTRVIYDGTYTKPDGKITKSKDVYEKSWIQQGYDYFMYHSCPIEKKEEDKIYKLLGWDVN